MGLCDERVDNTTRFITNLGTDYNIQSDMGKLANIVCVSLIFLMACGPSKYELEMRELAKQDSITAANAALEAKQKAEIEKQQKIAEEAKTKKYFLANQFDLIPGTIVGWAPKDEEIETWVCNGGKVANRTIYIHIQDAYGQVTVMPCSYMAWLNLHTGDVLR